VFLPAGLLRRRSAPAMLNYRLSGGIGVDAKPQRADDRRLASNVVGVHHVFPRSWGLVIEGELLAASDGRRLAISVRGRRLSTKSPPVFNGRGDLRLPFIGDQRPLVPFLPAGIGRDHHQHNARRRPGLIRNLFQTANFGGGLKFTRPAAGATGSTYRYFVIRSEPQSARYILWPRSTQGPTLYRQPGPESVIFALSIFPFRRSGPPWRTLRVRLKPDTTTK